MADFMKIGGRDSEGLARPFHTDADGKQTIHAESAHTYGWGNSGSKKRGYTDDWLFSTGTDETSLQTGVYFINNPIVKPHIDAGIPDFIEGTKFIAIPISAKGYRLFNVVLNNGWNTTVDVSAYRVPTVRDNDGFPMLTLFSQSIFENEVLSKDDMLKFHTGGLSETDVTQLPTGYLLIKLDYHSVPTSGQIRLGVERQQ